MNGNDWLIGRRGQALAVAVTLLLALVLWSGAVQPLLDWYGLRAETLRTQTERAERMESLAASLPALRRTVESGGGRVAASALLKGTSDSIAGATLQERVQAMASAAGATLTSVETLPAEDAGAWRRIGLRISLTTSWPVLIHLLQALDTAAPKMLVDDLHVHGAPMAVRPTALPLQTSFVVYGFRAGTPAGEARR